MAALAELLSPVWWAVLMDWLPRFDGFQAELECDQTLIVDDTPALQIIHALNQRGTPNLDQDLALLIAGCPFNGWRSRISNTHIRWSPLCQSFKEFQKIYPAPPVCYEVDPDMIEITAGWLLGMLYLKAQ